MSAMAVTTDNNTGNTAGNNTGNTAGSNTGNNMVMVTAFCLNGRNGCYHLRKDCAGLLHRKTELLTMQLDAVSDWARLCTY